MIIGSREILEALSESPVITIGDDDIKRVKDKTVLGIKLDDQLKWNKHNDEQCERISKSIYLSNKMYNAGITQSRLWLPLAIRQRYDTKSEKVGLQSSMIWNVLSLSERSRILS